MFNKQEARKIISDVRVTHTKKSRHESQRVQRTHEEIKKPRRIKKSSIFSGRVLTLSITFGIVAALILYVFFFSSLNLVVTPRKAPVDLGSGVRLTLPARIFESTHSKRGEGKSADSAEFDTKARGRIVVFNNFGAESQILVKNTRFESPQGFIYRTEERIVVPGKEGETPGQIEVEVTADEPGDDFNIGLTDFTIPGFKGSPKFDSFFARSKTEITGGASGRGLVVGQEEAENVLSKLEEEMRNELKNNFENSLNESGELISFASQNEYETTLRVTDPPVGSPADRFFGEVRGSARTMAIEKNIFEQMLAQHVFAEDYTEGVYRLSPNSSLFYSDVVFDYDKRVISLTAEGKAMFVWNIDENLLREEVLKAEGQDALDSVFDSFDGIARVEKTFRPAFIKRIPYRSSALHIEIKE